MKRFTAVFFTMMLVGIMTMLSVATCFAEDQVELRLTWWGSQKRHDLTIKVIELFEQKYPNIKIVYEFSGWGDYWTKMTTMAAGGNLPDVMQHDYARVGEWVGRDLLTPLDEFVEAGDFDFSNIPDSILSGGKVNGTLYGINLGTNSQAVILDIDAFKKAGVELPAQNWTWEDFEKISLELHEKSGIWGMGGGIADQQIWKSLYLGYGQWAYADDGKSLGYTDDQPLINHMNMLLRLMDAGAYPSREVVLSEYTSSGPEGSAIVSGKAAMAYFWSNQLTAIANAAGPDRNFTMTHLPRPKDGCCSSNYIKPSMFFTVPKQAKHPKEAAMFINFFVNSVEANKILMAERGVPVSSVVREELKSLLGAPQREAFDFLGRVADDSSPIRPADPAAHSDIYNNVYLPEFVDPVLLRQISVKEGVANLREMASEILSR